MSQLVTLPNGLQLVLTPQAYTKTVTVLVMVRVGSRYESENLAGISHFTEHMMFKGTKRRPDTQKISRELDAVGAEFNAFTSKEYTGYYIKAHSKYIKLALDILSDMLINSKLDEKEIEREKGVIIEEINMYEDTPMMMIEDVFEESIYDGNPLGRDVAGSHKTVSSLKRSDFTKFVKANYQPENMLVSIAGDIEVDSATKMTSDFFKFSKVSSSSDKFKKFGNSVKQADVKIKKKPTQQVHLAIGLRTDIGHTSTDLLPLKVANIILGGNMSSRLFINIRERQGLCYYIRSKVNSFIDTGDLATYAGLDVNRIDQAIKLIIKEFKKIKDQGIKASELKKAKEHVKGKMVINMENSSSVAQWYAERLLLAGKIETPEEFLEKIEKLNLEDINQLLNKIIDPTKLHLAIIGDFSDSSRFKKLLKI